MRTLTCKHKIWEKKVVHLSPDFIVLHVFNDLETCRPYKLMTKLEIDKFLKISSSGFQIIITFVGVDQIIYKSGNKST